MSDKQNSTLNEEREPLSKGWIFAGIVLFPLIPFVLIYFNKHLKKKMKMILGIVYFVFLFAFVYVLAAVYLSRFCEGSDCGRASCWFA